MTRFLELLELSRRAHKMGNRNFHKSVLGKELEKETNISDDAVNLPLSPGIYHLDNSEQTPPARYEDEYAFTK